MSDIKWLTVEKLNKICEQMIAENKGDYKIWLCTGGYYDSHAMDDNGCCIDDERKELSLVTPD